MKISIPILMAFATILGCTSFQTTQGQSTEVAISELAVGDTVEIVTADTEKLRFKITAIEDDALIGDDVRVPKADIRIVSVESIDPVKVAAVGGLTFGIVALIGLLLSFAALGAL